MSDVCNLDVNICFNVFLLVLIYSYVLKNDSITLKNMFSSCDTVCLHCCSPALFSISTKMVSTSNYQNKYIYIFIYQKLTHIKNLHGNTKLSIKSPLLFKFRGVSPQALAHILFYFGVAPPFHGGKVNRYVDRWIEQCPYRMGSGIFPGVRLELGGTPSFC